MIRIELDIRMKMNSLIRRWNGITYGQSISKNAMTSTTGWLTVTYGADHRRRKKNPEETFFF